MGRTRAERRYNTDRKSESKARNVWRASNRSWSTWTLSEARRFIKANRHFKDWVNDKERKDK
jgi:hypothetical protein